MPKDSVRDGRTEHDVRSRKCTAAVCVATNARAQAKCTEGTGSKGCVVKRANPSCRCQRRCASDAAVGEPYPSTRRSRPGRGDTRLGSPGCHLCLHASAARSPHIHRSSGSLTFSARGRVRHAFDTGCLITRTAVNVGLVAATQPHGGASADGAWRADLISCKQIIVSFRTRARSGKRHDTRLLPVTPLSQSQSQQATLSVRTLKPCAMYHAWQKLLTHAHLQLTAQMCLSSDSADARCVMDNPHTSRAAHPAVRERSALPGRVADLTHVYLYKRPTQPAAANSRDIACAQSVTWPSAWLRGQHASADHIYEHPVQNTTSHSRMAAAGGGIALSMVALGHLEYMSHCASGTGGNNMRSTRAESRKQRPVLRWSAAPRQRG